MSLDEVEPFAHTHKSESSLPLDLIDTKTCTVIGHFQDQLVINGLQFDDDLGGVAVFRHVLKSFLQHPIETEGFFAIELRRQRLRLIFRVDFVLGGKVTAKAFGCNCQSQEPEFG